MPQCPQQRPLTPHTPRANHEVPYDSQILMPAVCLKGAPGRQIADAVACNRELRSC